MRQAKLFGNPAPGSSRCPANQAGDFYLPTWGPSGSDDLRDFDPVMIEGLLEGGLQPVHPLAEVRERGGEGQVEVVAHGREGVDHPIEPLAGFSQRAFERPGCAWGGENIPAIVAAIDDVINRVGKLDTKSTGHAGSRRSSRRNDQPPVTPIHG